MTELRKIIHIDMDCFYAAVEVRDDPALRGHPVAVGGAPDRRGVIATCNYEARDYGVHSAMSSAHAKRLCPHLIFVRPSFDKYRHDSQVIREIFSRYTDKIEPLSLDEAYLDVTGSKHEKGSATLIAKAIREQIFSELELTASAGIAPNKFLAKVASDWNKPNGQFAVLPQHVGQFVEDLPVKKVHGVGKQTARKLENMGVYTCGDLQALDLITLTQKFGSFGQHLYERSRGIDHRQVSSDRTRKSLSVEHTYDDDLQTLEECLEQVPQILEQLKRRVARSGVETPINKEYVKLKFNDFTATTVERTSFGIHEELFFELMKEGFARRDKPVRLLGLGVKFQTNDNQTLRQLQFAYGNGSH